MSAANPGARVEVDGLARRFGPRWVLKRLDLRVGAGDALLITGPNGSGKTTLLRCLATALRPHDGHVRLDGEDLWPARDRLREAIGFLSHATRLYDDLSARDNLVVWARLAGTKADIDALLVRVSLPGDRRDPVRTFSAGMRRRLALAVTLLKSPRLMLLDEPFTALDPQGRALVGSLLGDLRAAGTTIVLTSHRPEEAAPFCTAAAHLDDGRIVWQGTPAEAVAGAAP